MLCFAKFKASSVLREKALQYSCVLRHEPVSIPPPRLLSPPGANTYWVFWMPFGKSALAPSIARPVRGDRMQEHAMESSAM